MCAQQIARHEATSLCVRAKEPRHIRHSGRGHNSVTWQLALEITQLLKRGGVRDMARMGTHDQLRGKSRVLLLQIFMVAQHLVGLCHEDVLHLNMQMRLRLLDQHQLQGFDAPVVRGHHL